MKRKKKPEPVLPPPTFPSAWERLPYSTPEGRRELERLLPVIADRITFRKDIEGAVHHACLAHDRQCRSDPKAAYKQLGDYHRKFDDGIEPEDVLGPEALGYLLSVKARDEQKHHGPLSKEQRLRQIAEAQVRANSRVTRIIIDPVDPDDPNDRPVRRGGGPRRDWIAHGTMHFLIGLWETQTGSKPTITTASTTTTLGKTRYVRRGPFVEFCEAFFVPLYRELGRKAQNWGDLAHRRLTKPDEEP